jgi:hypothetical protein
VHDCPESENKEEDGQILRWWKGRGMIYWVDVFGVESRKWDDIGEPAKRLDVSG